MGVESWAPMTSVISGAVPPPLRWSAPAGGRRPELAALRRDARPERLAGIARYAPPVPRDGGLVESDGIIAQENGEPLDDGRLTYNWK